MADFDFTTLITDRTEADVARARAIAAKIAAGAATPTERAEWDADLKGPYNASDLNRVGAAAAALAETLRDYGYDVTVTGKIDWVTGQKLTAAEIGAYLNDVEALRAALGAFPTTPETPVSLDDLTVEKENAIERILLDVYRLIENTSGVSPHSGTAYSGAAFYIPEFRGSGGQTVLVIPSTERQIVTNDAKYDYLYSVVVDGVPVRVVQNGSGYRIEIGNAVSEEAAQPVTPTGSGQVKTVAPAEERQTITPDPGYDRLDYVIVEGVPFTEAKSGGGYKAIIGE